MKKGLVIFIVIAVLLGFVGCNTYNGLVGLDEGVNSKWAQVETQYQRRADLIPNLVNTVKGVANFEQSTLTQVVQARANATSIKVDPKDLTPEKMQEFQAAQGQLSQALGRLLMITENYPELKANQNFTELQAQLEGTENRIAVARKDYNEEVQTYNTRVRKFPAALFAGIMGFKQREMFKADEGAKTAPTVDFNSK